MEFKVSAAKTIDPDTGEDQFTITQKMVMADFDTGAQVSVSRPQNRTLSALKEERDHCLNRAADNQQAANDLQAIIDEIGKL